MHCAYRRSYVTQKWYACMSGVLVWAGICLSGVVAWGETLITLEAHGDLAGAIASARRADRPVTIRLQPGAYELQAPLRLGEEDRGITIECAPNSQFAEIVGSQRLTGWQLVDAATQMWKVEVPETRAPALGASPEWEPRQLFIDGHRAPRARTPNEGWWVTPGGFRIQDGITRLPLPAEGAQPAWISEQGELIFTAKWVTMRSRPVRWDTANHEVEIVAENPRDYLSEASHWFAWENTSESLDSAGEWRHDAATGTIYLMAPEGCDPNKAMVTIPWLMHLLEIDGADDIILRGLTFAESDYRWPWRGRYDAQAACDLRGMVQVRNARHGKIEQCRFANGGGHGLDFGAGTENWTVHGCRFEDLGAGGVRIGEMDTKSARCGGHVIENCTIVRYGRLHPAGCGVIIFQSDGNKVSHNEIAEGFYTGISVGWTWGYQASPCHHNEIAWNHVHDIGYGVLSDMGGIYTLGPQPGTVVHHNLFRDITRRHYGGWGLYTDEGSTGIVLENNIVIRCQSAGFHQHYGKENVVRNNLFVWCDDHALMRTREEEHQSFLFERNVILSRSGTLLGSNWANGHFAMRHNIWWDQRHGQDAGAYRFAGQTWQEWQRAGHDQGSRIADPRLADPEHPEKGLALDSPAMALGWQPLDLTGVGPK